MQPSYIFGGNTGWTYDQLQRNKQIADSLMMGFDTPRNVGEGLSAIGKALAIRGINKKADTEGERMRGEYEAKRSKLFEALSGGANRPSYTPPNPSSPQGIAADTMRAIGKAPSQDWLKANVFPGESGGDYDALFGYANRPGGQFEGVKLTDMTVDEALAFADPNGPYAQTVKGQVGRVATPMGAYQVVGTTLKAAKDALGLTGQERMTPELQDKIGMWIYEAQGPGAWEAWGGKGSGGPDMGRIAAALEVASDPMATPGDKMMAEMIVNQLMEAADPMRALEIERANLEIEALRNPKPGFTKLTDDQEAQMGLNTSGVYQIDADGKIHVVQQPERGAQDPIADLRARAAEAGLKPGTPEYAKFMLDNGKTPDGMVIESDGQGGFRMVQGAGATTAAAKPFTEAQSKDVVFSTRAKGALEALEPVAGALTSRPDVALDWLPFGLGGGGQSDEYQVAVTAGNEFLQAILRKDTGAAITKDEQALYGETYLPQPGDSPERLKYKSEARRRAIAAIEAGMSPAQMIAQEKALAAPPAEESEDPLGLR